MQPIKKIQVDGWAALPNIPCHGPAFFSRLRNLFVLMLCRLSTTFKWTTGRAPRNTPQLFSRCWKNFFLDCIKRFKNIRTFGWAMLPQTQPSSFHGVKEPFRLDVLQPFKNIQSHGWAALLNIPCHGPVHFAALRNLFVLMLCRLSTTFKWTAGRAPPNTVQGVSRCWKRFLSGWYEAIQKHSNLWLGRAPQTRPSSFHGVEEHIRLDVMKPLKHIQVDGWAALSNIPCHGPAHFPALKNLFVLLLCRLWTTFKWTDGRAPPNTFLFISRCWKMFWSGSFEASPKHSNLWLGCAPPNTAQIFLRCWKFFFLHGMKLFKNIRTYGWVVIPQLQPSLVHGVEYPFRLDVLQPFRNIQVYGGAAFSNIPVTAQLILRRWKIISFWCCADFQQRSNERMVVLPQTRSRAFHGVEELFLLDCMKLFKNYRVYGWAVLPKHGPFPFTVLKNIFVWMLWSQSNTFKLMVGPRSPTSPVTAQLILRRWRIISFCYCADFEQRSNERMVVLPQTHSCSFHGVEKCFGLDPSKRFQNIRTYGWAVLLQTRPISFHGVENYFFCMVWSFLKTFEPMAGLWSPNYSPVLFTVLNIRFVWMFCSRSETFKFMAGPRSPISLSRLSSFRGVEDSFRFDVMQSFKNVQMNGWSCSPKRGPVLFTVLKILLVWMLCSQVKHSSLWLGRAPQRFLSRPSSFGGVKESFRFDVM